MTRIGIALFDGAEELDWAGPWEVLAAWSKQWPDDDVEVFTVAQGDGAVTCAKGLRVVPDRTWGDAGKLDVLVYPGGRGTRRELKDQSVLEWLHATQQSGTLMTSVCTGALVYAAAGFLRDRPATTYWSSFDELRAGGVRCECREPLAQDSVRQERSEPVVVHLAVQLVLAARRREDHLGAPADGPLERRIRCRVAGMQRDDHVRRLTLEQRDVAELEPQPFVPQCVRQRPAALDHVLLEIEADDLHVEPALDREQVVERKGEIRLPRPEVDDS